MPAHGIFWPFSVLTLQLPRAYAAIRRSHFEDMPNIFCSNEAIGINLLTKLRIKLQVISYINKQKLDVNS